MNEEAFAEVRGLFEAWMQQVPQISDELLKKSTERLRANESAFPEWIALGKLAFRWRFQSRFDGTNTRFLLWDKSASAREMLDAEISVQLGPAPMDEGEEVAEAEIGNTKLHLPHLLWREPSPEDFRRVAPEGATPDRTTVLRLGEGETLACWIRPDTNTPELAERIKVRWVGRSGTWDVGPKGSWPVELFMSLARALAATESSFPRAAGSFDSLNRERNVWQLAGHALGLRDSITHWLEEGERKPLADPRLEAMRCRWKARAYSVRAGALVNTRGALAGGRDDDTFLAPFRVVDDGGELSLFLELPDILARGAVRQVLLDEFVARRHLNKAAQELNEQFPGDPVTVALVEEWCASENAHVLRVDRKDHGRTEEYLLALDAVIGKTRVAVLVSADKVVLKYEHGEWSIEDFGDTDLIYAGPTEGALLKWDSFLGGPRAQLFADALAILARWRELL